MSAFFISTPVVLDRHFKTTGAFYFPHTYNTNRFENTFSRRHLTLYERACAEWGIRDCWDIEDYNGMVMSLGEDAMDNATLYEDEEEDEGPTML